MPPASPQAEAVPEGALPPLQAAVPCLLAWLVPGAGHVYLRRRVRGVAYFAIVLVCFLMGLALDGRAYLADREHPLTFLATFANLGLGPLDLVQREVTYDRLVWFLPREQVPYTPAPPTEEGARLLERMRQRVRSPKNEYGTMFLLTAGLMNLLLILDAYDIARGRKLPPPESPPA